MANKMIWRTALNGGASGALDYIDGDLLADGDAAVVVTATNTYFYRLNATSGSAESYPGIIVPDTNPGAKAWVLNSIFRTSDQNYVTATEKTVIENTSGTNTGDQDISGYQLIKSRDDHGTITATEDFSALSTHHTVTMATDQSWTLSGFDAASPEISIRLSVTTICTVTLPGAVTIPANSEVTTLASLPVATYDIEVVSYDDGTSYTMRVGVAD